MKTYKLELVIKEGNDEFWEQIKVKGTGCDEVMEVMEQMLEQYGFFIGDNCELTLVEYKNVE